MRLSVPPMPSFGRLAETCLEHSDWPVEVDLQPRSLATLFSKLDREVDLDWLRDRVDVQRVICRVLERPLGDLRVALGEPPTLLHGRRLRLADARYARELDLGREALPPGIPERAQSPSDWQKGYWVAAPGAGKSLVGAWLLARGLAEVVTVESDADWTRLPKSGPLYVELGRTASPPRNSTLAELLRRPSPVCLAGPGPDAPEGFDAFESPPIESYLQALIEWLAARLDGSGHFVPTRAETWLRQVAMPHRAVVGFGEVLGLLGAQDEFTPQSLRGKSLDDLAAAFVERRLASALVDSSWGPRTATQAFDALSHAAARCLVEPGLELGAPRALDAWAELLALTQDAPDEEWLVRAMRLADDDSGRTKRVEQVAKRLPPSGYRLARSLSLGGLLSARDGARVDSELTLGPRWLVSVLSARANAAALEMSPADWGAALLDSSKRPELEAALSARFARGHFEPVEMLLDQLDLADPSHLAALDACLRQLADVELMGEPVPDELRGELLERACDGLIDIAGRLSPTLGLAGAGAHRAALAVLCRNQPLPERKLDPHRTSVSAVRALYAHDCAAAAFAKPDDLALAWLGLARDLGRDGDEPHLTILELVRCLLERLDTPEKKGSSWPEAVGRELELGLHFAVRERGDKVLGVAWDLLSLPQLGSILDGELSRKLWLRAPAQRLPELFASGVAIPFASLLPHHYVGWLQAGACLPLFAAEHCPLEAVLERVSAVGPVCLEPDALRALLIRSPRLAQVLVQRLRADEAGADLALFESRYASALDELTRALPSEAELLLWPRPALDRVRALLVARIGKLGPRVEAATSRLRALELALGPYRR